jgi:hypothetical protein
LNAQHPDISERDLLEIGTYRPLHGGEMLGIKWKPINKAVWENNSLHNKTVIEGKPILTKNISRPKVLVI